MIYTYFFKLASTDHLTEKHIQLNGYVRFEDLEGSNPGVMDFIQNLVNLFFLLPWASDRTAKQLFC